MYAAHQGGQSLRAEFSAPDVHYERDEKAASFWGLNGSASRNGNVVTLTMVNPDLTKSSDAQVALHGARNVRATGTVLAAADMRAHNTFDHPDNVKTAPLNVTLNGEMLTVSIPAASVTKLEIVLG
jgi:alpha-N-arabinofuranosidase